VTCGSIVAQMPGFPRYAIYHTAAQGSDLDRFGAQHLGYDAWAGDDLPFPADVVETVADWRELTHDPRKYGFHATLKAPMTLADGSSESELVAACAAFAKAPRRIPVIKPIVQSISGFIAVIPAEPSPALQQLAAGCVAAFDSFRKPLTAEDRARRNPSRLTAKQCEYLDRWGYPYVMDEFRFHMTLTGRLDDERRGPILVLLQDRFARLRIERLAVDRIAVFRQDNAVSRFRIISQWQLHA
jgi:putative phosphonate metabolism protein